MSTRLPCWSFVMDGHRFYVLSLGTEGDWAYDTTTKEWCQLQTTGLDGLNFSRGVMWGIRVVGGDTASGLLNELDPNATTDNGTTIKHVVTGGVPTRSRDSIGVSDFTLTASVGDVSSVTDPITLAFSDDNGVTYSPEFPITLTNSGSQTLIWTALGSFSSPGRIFRITDYSGPVRLDGADCTLSGGDPDHQ